MKILRDIIYSIIIIGPLWLATSSFAITEYEEQILDMRAREYVRTHPEWQFPKGSGKTCECRLYTVKQDIQKSGLNDCCYKWMRGGFTNNGKREQIRLFKYCPVCGKEIDVFYMGGQPEIKEIELGKALARKFE